MSVRRSVHDVPVSDEDGLTYRHSFFSPYGSPVILVLPASNIFTKFRRGHPYGGAKYRWGIKISRFSTNKSLYLANDTRYRHSYYGRRIGTRMRSIRWCHFQWPWTNSNLFSMSHHSLTLNISQTATDTAIVTIEGEWETAPKLLNGTSFSDLEWSLSQISRSRYYSTSNNSQMVQDRAIVTMAD